MIDVVGVSDRAPDPRASRYGGARRLSAHRGNAVGFFLGRTGRTDSYGLWWAPSISAVTGCSRQGAGTRHRLLRVRHVVQISQSAARSGVKTHPCFGLMIFARAGGCDRRLRTGGGMRAVRSAGLGAALILAAPVA